jgi:hypothetical protein
MAPKDIQLARLTRNMRNFADAVSAQTLEQANRQAQAVAMRVKKHRKQTRARPGARSVVVPLLLPGT